jgi:hypothetical protein
MSYNMVFTAVPILFFVLDRDRERDSLLTNPKHYQEVWADSPPPLPCPHPPPPPAPAPCPRRPHLPILQTGCSTILR